MREALASFQAATRVDPDNADAYVGLGTAHYASGDNKAAEHALVRALERDGKNADAHHNLALVYEAAGAPDKAHAHYVLALEQRPNHEDDVLGAARTAVAASAGDA